MTSRTFDHLLVDGKNLLYRTAWANQMLQHRNRPTGGIFGFLRTLICAHEELGRPVISVCWEGRRNWRFERFPGYKSTRRKDPREGSSFDVHSAVSCQQPRLRALLALCGVAQWRTSDGEGDDVMHTLANDLAEDGLRVAVLSQDRDLYQVTANPMCEVIRSNKEGDWVVVNGDDCHEELGVPPEKIPAWKALAGDSSDGIPGVHRIGPKIAAKLVAPHATLQQLLAAARSGEGWTGTPRQRTQIHEHAEDVRLYEEIVKLRSCELERSDTYTPPDRPALQYALKELGILSLTEREPLESLCSMGGVECFEALG